MVTVALLGFGLSGRYLQAPYLLANPNFRLKTILSGNQNPQEIYPGVSVSRSLDEILNDPEIDFISVATPNDTHYEYAKKALLAGKHVLIEKPFAANTEQANELIELSKKQNKVLTVFQNRRFDSDFRTVRQIVQSGVLGELLSYEAHFDRYKPVLNTKQWKETVSPMSGILFDLGSHLIDQAISLFGTPDEVAGETFIQRENSSVDDAFNVRLSFGELKVTLKSSLLVREEGPRYVLHGTKGSFVKYGMDIQEDQLKAGLKPGSVDFGKEPAANRGLLNTEINGLHFRGTVETLDGNWDILFQNIYEAITEGKELMVKPEQVAEQLKVIGKIR